MSGRVPRCRLERYFISKFVIHFDQLVQPRLDNRTHRILIDRSCFEDLGGDLLTDVAIQLLIGFCGPVFPLLSAK